MNSPKIMVVAGEASGDQHAARLVQALREDLPEARFYGIGGDALAAQGMRLACHVEDMAVIGLTEVFHKIPVIWKAFQALWRYLREERPDLVILVDFPDFNFLVLRLARRFGVPVLYYISPQVWAWRRGRVKTIARLVNRMVVIFPFEEAFYRQHGVDVTYVGHPLLETMPDLPPRGQLREQFDLEPDDLAVALLPGSRIGEISQLLPEMLESALQLKDKLPRCKFILPLADTAPADLVAQLVAAAGVPVSVHQGQTHEILAAADIALVTSGTATLETALSGTPMVIVYRITALSFSIGRLLIRVPHIGMANLLAEEGLFQELIQHEVEPERITAAILRIIRDPDRLSRISAGIKRIKVRLGGPGASKRAAAVALDLLKLSKNHKL